MSAMRRVFWLTLLGTLTSARGWSLDADLQALNAIAAEFQAHVHVQGIPDAAFQPPAKILLYTTPPFSFYEKRTVTEARFNELPPPVQSTINQWATFTTDQPSGEALFRDMFYRLFFVHELGHWTQARVLTVRERAGEKIADTDLDYYQGELQSNRIAIAWWREHDARYLDRLIADFRRIEAHLPNPVPAGQDTVQYFNQNYTKLSENPNAYSWYQLGLVITAYDQPPQTFQQVLDGLPAVRYTLSAAGFSR